MYWLQIWYPRGKDSTKFQDLAFPCLESVIEFEESMGETRYHDGEAIGTDQHKGYLARKMAGTWSLHKINISS